MIKIRRETLGVRQWWSAPFEPFAAFAPRSTPMSRSGGGAPLRAVG